MPTYAIHQGDARAELKHLARGSIHCAVTSPPYWGQRDYEVDGQIGLERSLEEYLTQVGAVFKEVYPVLRDDGTLWVVIGDCYVGDGGTQRNSYDGDLGEDHAGYKKWERDWGSLQIKDLVGLPWRFAFSMQAQGWRLRSANIWLKPNGRPGSAVDRPNLTHEYVFEFAKQERIFYDPTAVREEAQEGTRHLRSVWVIPAANYPKAHFATFPERVAEIPILAGTSAKGACAKCGGPWRRIILRRTGPHSNRWSKKADAKEFKPKENRYVKTSTSTLGVAHYVDTIGWEPTCRCYGEPLAEKERGINNALWDKAVLDAWPVVPCTVLDPFAGSGTTLAVAKRLGRSAVGVELNPEYVQLGRARLNEVVAPLTTLELASQMEARGEEE